MHHPTERSDFEEFPDDELGLLARYFYDADRLTAATRVLDVLVDRENPDGEYVELYENVEARIRELLG